METVLKPLQQKDFLEYYCDINDTSLCRLCLERNQGNEKMFNIFEELQCETMHISAMIMSCANVQIIEGDGLPATICQKCLNNLSKTWQFKLQCEASDVKLRQFYNNSGNMQITPDLDSLGFNCINKDNQTDLYVIKSVETSSTYNEDNDNSLQSDNNDDSGNVEVEKEFMVKNGKQKSEKVKDQKVHQCDACGKTFNRREYLTQHIRIHTGEKPYHCHLCEKKFVNSGHLTTHMRTHTGEKPHSCKLCPKAFSTRQELQKHTMVHNGERPFICKMCGKRFGSSSNLYSHLKHHTGEKNFKCDNCGKSFYTKQELKQHSVVHTGEKAFVCESCNKRFSQIAHLRRHTKLHK